MIASPSLLRISKIPSTGSRQPSSISRSAVSRSGRLATNRSTTVLPSGRRYCNANRSMVPIASASSTSSRPALSRAAASDRSRRGLHAKSTRSRFSSVLRSMRTASPSSPRRVFTPAPGPVRPAAPRYEDLPRCPQGDPTASGRDAIRPASFGASGSKGSGLRAMRRRSPRPQIRRQPPLRAQVDRDLLAQLRPGELEVTRDLLRRQIARGDLPQQLVGPREHARDRALH